MTLKDHLLTTGLAGLAIKSIVHLPAARRLAWWQKANAWLACNASSGPVLREDSTATDSRGLLRSSTCKQADFHSRAYHDWCAEINVSPRFHRKQWEFYYIGRALTERGLLTLGKRGLGFGVGKEPLAAVFARAGCELLLTDMALDEAKEQGWATTNQHATNVGDLNIRNLCPQEKFLAQVRFETADMNHIPDDFRDFDFCWSSCALEHLGSIDLGLSFITRSLDCLKPGGIAVHTTEFNVCSNDATLDNASTVLFRRRDLDRLQSQLAAAGHTMEPLVFDFGNEPLDAYIDMPPYKTNKHLKLALAEWVTTSVGIIVRKAST
jgi:hypothetical protein